MSFVDPKQILIVRQSSLERALEFYKIKNHVPTAFEIIRTAELFKDFVYEGTSTDVIERCTKLEKYLAK